MFALKAHVLAQDLCNCWCCMRTVKPSNDCVLRCCRLRDQMDTMLTNDRELSLLVAMETALVDERYDVRPSVLGRGGVVVSGVLRGFCGWN
jgi:hypothetical protein